MEIKPITEIWDDIVEPLRAMCEVSRTNDWRVEDVYMALAKGEADVITFEGDGFIIFYSRPRNYREGEELVIWFAHNPTGSPVTEDDYEEILEDLAKRFNCDRIVMSSPRKGFARKPFWTEASTTYYRDVT